MKQLRWDCQECGAPIPASRRKGRPRKHCSDACKQAAYRKEAEADKNLCKHCGEQPRLKGQDYCSDRCFYYAHRGALPPGKEHLAAWDEDLIPFVPMGQQHAFDVNRPDWHAWVYGGSERPHERK